MVEKWTCACPRQALGVLLAAASATGTPRVVQSAKTSLRKWVREIAVVTHALFVGFTSCPRKDGSRLGGALTTRPCRTGPSKVAMTLIGFTLRIIVAGSVIVRVRT